MRGPAVLFILAALFVVELLAWLILAMWGWTIGAQWGDTAGAIGAVGAFAAIAALWALLASPKSHAPDWVKWTVKVLVFGGAALTLVLTEQVAAGIAFAVVAAALLWVARTESARDTLEAIRGPREPR
ncbi:Protein of unknown function [Agrococcus baldri]|uniref:DUF2568 domain-containing protein n=1 Tax=Agrococcus baldri TaxID=153730 RepID=A0AA94HLG0_9MICO|nr:DUF2568 domain-containing protein [Agrococcus baldri]SFS04051.1 Protein of unknown function [Agrococcus baldri]